MRFNYTQCTYKNSFIEIVMNSKDIFIQNYEYKYESYYESHYMTHIKWMTVHLSKML